MSLERTDSKGSSKVHALSDGTTAPSSCRYAQVHEEDAKRECVYVQSALMVLCNAPSDQYSAIEESGVGKLLWEFMRTSMDCLQRMSDAKQHTARAPDSRV